MSYTDRMTNVVTENDITPYADLFDVVEDADKEIHELNGYIALTEQNFTDYSEDKTQEITELKEKHKKLRDGVKGMLDKCTMHCTGTISLNEEFKALRKLIKDEK